MRVIATLLVRDEIDIVKQCIDHHLAHGVDGFIVTDHRSVDGTSEVLKNHPGVLTVINRNDDKSYQSIWVTRMARMACDYKADWVINIDADEFWYGMEYLSELPPSTNELVVYKLYNHCPTPWFRSNEEFRREDYPYSLPKYPTPPNKGKTIHRAHPKVSVVRGNHRIKSGLWRNRKVMTDRELPQFYVHHYPFRTFEHCIKKCQRSIAQQLRGVNPGSHTGKQWLAFKNDKVEAFYAAKCLSREDAIKKVANGKILYFENVDDNEYQTSRSITRHPATESPETRGSSLTGSSGL